MTSFFVDYSCSSSGTIGRLLKNIHYYYTEPKISKWLYKPCSPSKQRSSSGPCSSFNQSINQNLYSAQGFKTQRCSRPRPSRKEQSWDGGGIENRYRLGGALDLLEVHSRLLYQPQKKNGSALSQSGRMGPPNYREQRTGVYDGLNRRRQDGRARADTSWRS